MTMEGVMSKEKKKMGRGRSFENSALAMKHAERKLGLKGLGNSLEFPFRAQHRYTVSVGQGKRLYMWPAAILSTR